MSKPRVLVVDDEKELLRSIERILRRDDLEVTTATSAEEALLGMQQTVPPDLIISDLMMPGIGGLEMLKLVSRKHPNVPVPVRSSRFTPFSRRWFSRSKYACMPRK